MSRRSNYKLTREAPKKMTKHDTAEYYLSHAIPFKSPASSLQTDCLGVDVRIDIGYCYVPKPIDSGSCKLHNIILDVKIGGFKKGEISRHLCHTPKCINPQHLVQGTRADNNQDRASAGRSADMRGEKHSMAILTEPQVIEMRRLRAYSGWTYKRLGVKFGVHKQTICSIIHRKSWKHI